MSAGIRDIMLISTPDDMPASRCLLGESCPGPGQPKLPHQVQVLQAEVPPEPAGQVSRQAVNRLRTVDGSLRTTLLVMVRQTGCRTALWTGDTELSYLVAIVEVIQIWNALRSKSHLDEARCLHD